MNRIVIELAGSLGLALSAAAGAQSPPEVPSAPRPSFDPATVVRQVRELIAERYVLPEMRPKLDTVLAEGLASGRYAVTEGGLLAERINADLARVSGDQHLYFRYDPVRVAALAPAIGAAPDGPPDMTPFIERARTNNHGWRGQRVLPGNVRLVELVGFDWVGEESQKAIASAMQFLADGDAAIIDLRRNGGGSGRAVHEVISYFVEAGKPLISFRKGAESSPLMSSLPGLSGLVGKRLYVLTSGETASAGEEFVGHVSGYALGTVVGETTAGAAYMNSLHAFEEGFELSISEARPVLAATGKDWERVGIAPTLAVPAERALDAALAHALRAMAEGAPDHRKAELGAIADGVVAAAQNVTPALPLTAYTGTFGDRRVFLEGGRLRYQQERRMPRDMIAMGGHRFLLADSPGHRLDFIFEGPRAVAIDLTPPGGPVQARLERIDS
jgi:hypothetical protein